MIDISMYREWTTMEGHRSLPTIKHVQFAGLRTRFLISIRVSSSPAELAKPRAIASRSVHGGLAGADGIRYDPAQTTDKP